MGKECYAGKKKFPHLFSPIRIGNIRLKNRIIAAPTSPSMITTEGHFTPEMIAYLEEKAKGGASVVTYGESCLLYTSSFSANAEKYLRLWRSGILSVMQPNMIRGVTGKEKENNFRKQVKRSVL